MVQFRWGCAQKTQIEMEWNTGDVIWRRNDYIHHPSLPNGHGLVSKIRGRDKTQSGSVKITYEVDHM